MRVMAPLRITVEIRLTSGSAAGQRRFRLSEQIALPAGLTFDGSLPVVGGDVGRLRFVLPTGVEVEADARWVVNSQDPDDERPACAAELLGLTAAQQQAIETYIQQRVPS